MTVEDAALLLNSGLDVADTILILIVLYILKKPRS